MIIRARSTGLIIFLALVGNFTRAHAISPITDLIAQTGANEASVNLQWTVPAGVINYAIKYQAGTAPIADETSWGQANSIDQPPLNISIPLPVTSGTMQSLTISGLQAGSDYAFGIRSFDSSQLISDLSNTATAQAKTVCGQSASDGQGTFAISPAVIQAGEITTFTSTFTAGSVGVAQGGVIELRVPDFMTPPQMTSPGTPGYISYQGGSGVSATFSSTLTGQSIDVKVESGSLQSGNQLIITYVGFTCATSGTASFHVKSKVEACGLIAEIANSPFNVAMQFGLPRYVAFRTFELPVVVNQITPLTLALRDYCGDAVTTANDLSVNVHALLDTGNGIRIDDPLAQMSINSDLSTAFSQSTITIHAGQSSQTLYYKITSPQNLPNDYISMTFQEFQPPNDEITYFAHVTPVATGITNPSVDTGIAGALPTVTFTPDNDGVNDNAFIHATLPSNMGWKIELSKDNFATVTRTLFGQGDTINVAWDGYTDGSNTVPTIGPANTYVVKITAGGSLINTALSITLSASSVQGRIVDAVNVSSPIANANIQIFGVSQRSAVSDANGNFQASGLKAGSYTINVNKTGYAPQNIPVTVSNGVNNISDIALVKQSILELTLQRPNSGTLYEVWGNISAHDATWNTQANAGVHFAEGKTTADAGDLWNPVPTPVIDITFPPSKDFVVTFNIPGLGANDLAVPALSPNSTRQQTVSLQRRADIGGQITCPPNENATGLSISIQASLRGSQQRFYAGMYMQPGSTTGYYQIAGVDNGTYDLTIYAPGFIAGALTANVTNDIDVPNANATLSDGGNFNGTITITGDTTSLGIGGFLSVNLSANSQAGGAGSSSNVQVAVSSFQATAAYQIKGLSDGTYDVFPFLAGFELVPSGPKSVLVNGGIGHLDLTFRQFNGSVQGNITLPAGHSDYAAVSLELDPQDGNNQTSSTISDNSGHFRFDHVATGFYSLRGLYQTTGFLTTQSVPVVNGQTSAMNLDLTGQTYSISGHVTTQASTPFNSLNYYVNSTTPTLVQTSSGTLTLPANRIEATLINSQSNNSPPPNSNNLPFFDTRQTFAATVALDGTYTFPQLPPGVYKMKNNGEMDNNAVDGNEVVENYQVITIKNAAVSDVNFQLQDGITITGTLGIADGATDNGRDAVVFLMDKDQKRISQTPIFLVGNSAPFTLTHVPAGTFTLSAQDNDFPSKYWADSNLLEVKTNNITGQTVTLSQAGKIQGQLRIKNGDLITHINAAQLLPDGFQISAAANPFKPNGYASTSGDILDTNDQFALQLGAGTYDLQFGANDVSSLETLSRGVKAIVPLQVSGIAVLAGQTKDVGVIELVVGENVTGTVTDANAAALPNITVKAAESGVQSHNDNLTSLTDQTGKYSINGLDPQKKYTIIASPYPDSSDNRFGSGFSGTRYGEARKTNVSPTAGISIDFRLKPAPGSISGRVRSPDGSDLVLPFDNNNSGVNLPGAAVIANLKGTIPLDNPLGDIQLNTQSDGSFVLGGLAAGQYDVWLLAQGYGSVKLSNVTVGLANTDVGTQTLVAGSKLSGKILDANGKSIRTTICDTLVAVANGFADILIANLTTDSSGSIIGYSVSGFKANTSYDVLGFDDNNDITSFGSVVVNSDAEKNLQVTNSSLAILPMVTRNNDGSVSVRFEFSTALDNSSTDLDNDGVPDSSEPSKILNLVSGNGALNFTSDWLSSDRKNITVTYTPTDQTAFVLKLTATFNVVDPATGANQSVSQNFTFYPGLGSEVTRNIPNASGGTVTLDAAAFSVQAGFHGDNASQVIPIKIREAANIEQLPSANTSHASSVMALVDKLGVGAYPPEMAPAFQQIRKLDVNPFASFYDIFLPEGVSHFFPEGKEAQLCLVYDSGISDPGALNIYYYNPNTSQYLLENQNKLVDTDNQLLCVNISHASVFTILNSSASVITAGGYTGELGLLNFPNPFDLKTKTVTLQNPGTANAAQTIDGTMIKISLPPSMNGSIQIKIYDVAGEDVRTLEIPGATGGTYYYLEWDGKNDHGKKVASGTYIARFTIDGGNEKFFKMAVLK